MAQLGRGWLVASSITAVLVYTIDATVANIALPYMQGSLQASQDQVAWILTSYIVASAVCTPLAGYFATRFGIGRVLVTSVGLFTLASVLCGLATSLPQMVVFRALQGGMGASLVPLSQVLLLKAYPPALHGRANGLWSMGVLVGPILGPSLGGWLTEFYGWRWAFLINLPVGIVAVVGLLATMPKDEPDQTRRFDLVGFVWLSVAVGLLQLGLDRGHGQNWFQSTEIIIEFALAGLAFYAFVAHSLTHPTPFIPLRLFADRNFVLALGISFCMGFLIVTPAALLPQFLQQVQGYPVLDAGIMMASRGIGAIVTTVWLSKNATRFDTRWLAGIGLGATAISMTMFMQMYIDTPAWWPVTGAFIQGVAISFLFLPVTNMAYATLPVHLRTDGGVTSSLCRNIGSSIGLSWVFAQVLDSAQRNRAYMAEQLGAFETQRWVGLTPALERVGGLGANGTVEPGTLASLIGPEMARQAAAIGYDNGFAWMALATVLALPLVLLMKPPQRP
jgi:DHA2 family multidrug resistance protein